MNSLSKLDSFIFKELDVLPTEISQAGIDDFNQRKQKIYLTSDIFLQISLCEVFKKL